MRPCGEPFDYLVTAKVSTVSAWELPSVSVFVLTVGMVAIGRLRVRVAA